MRKPQAHQIPVKIIVRLGMYDQVLIIMVASKCMPSGAGPLVPGQKPHKMQGPYWQIICCKLCAGQKATPELLTL